MKNNNARRVAPSYSGWYRYKNTSGADIVLPHPLTNGRTVVGRNAFFEGDSRYRNISGVVITDDLCHYIKSEVKPEVKEAKKEEKTLLVDQVQGNKLEVIQENKVEDDSELILTLKELTEFASLKGITVSKNMSKKRIIDRIRQVGPSKKEEKEVL